MAQFHSFIVLAEMRTGSNFLEANLNSFEGLTCHGEAFNLSFIGYPKREKLLGMTLEQRNADPLALLAKLREAPGLRGFRFFHDHDLRVLDACLLDPGCAKIILTRNPLDSYISWKIARATGQWKLTGARPARSEVVAFDAEEFDAHVTRLQDFQLQILNRMQMTGQTGFYLGYEDLQKLEVMNGLAEWLGCPDRLERLDGSLKKQNPKPAQDKVSNPQEMTQALSRFDRFNLTRTPNFEPRRGPAVPSYLAAPQSPLLFMPLRSGPVAAVTDWLSALDGGAPVQSGFTQKSLRQWMTRNGPHRAFVAARHPVERAHTAFCDRILSVEPGCYPRIRNQLIRGFGLELPEPGDAEAHSAAFKVFLRFLKANLVGQSAIRTDAAWSSQVAAIQGFGDMRPPDLILREDELPGKLAELAAWVGRPDAPDYAPAHCPNMTVLSQVYDDEIESLTAEAYARDYLVLGFSRWR